MRAFSSPSATKQSCVGRGLAAPARAQRQQPQAATRQGVLAAGLLAVALQFAGPSHAEFRLPPIDKDPNRCDRGYVGNTIGQANAVSDKVLDLRQCKYPGADLNGKVLSGALMSEADFSKANMRESVMSKAYAVGANFEGADMTNAVIDRVDFRKANMRGVQFGNAVVTGSFFDGTDLDGADFEDALIGNEDAKKLCLNPTVKGNTRVGIGCRGSPAP